MRNCNTCNFIVILLSAGFDELYLIPIEIFLSFDLILNDGKVKLFFGKLNLFLCFILPRYLDVSFLDK